MNREHQPTTRVALLPLGAGVVIAFVAALVCVVSVVAQAGVVTTLPPMPKLKAASLVADAPSNKISLTLAWDAYNPKFLTSGQTNTTTSFVVTPTASTTITQTLERIVIVNYWSTTKNATNYTLWNGTNLVASTNSNSAVVSFARGTTPTFALRATLADGQQVGTGTFSLPKNPQTSALLSVAVDGAPNHDGPWAETTNVSVLLESAQLAAPAGYFRTRMNIRPFGTNATGWAFTPNVYLITNSP